MFTRKIVDILNRGEALVLATIVRHRGSTPRSAGSKMLFESDGTAFGSVGGGKMEALVAAAAREILTTRCHKIMAFSSGESSAAQLDAAEMVCGGELTVLLEYMAPDSPLQDLMEITLKYEEKGKKAIHAAAFVQADSAVKTVERAVLEKQDVLGMTPHFPGDFIPRILDAAASGRKPRLLYFGESRCFVEPPHITGALIIAGSGHVAREVVTLASRVDFHITVLDDRDEFTQKAFFPNADDLICIDGFQCPFDAIAIHDESFILIMTRGHQYDRMVLAHALRTNAAYIGMMGSKRKRENIFGALLNQGFSEDDLNRVHCPVGVSIQAETPAEIAVSVVAEMIATRAGLYGGNVV